MTKKKTSRTEKTSRPEPTAVQRLAGNAAYAGKPGLAYLTQYLPHLDHSLDAAWIAESIDSGDLIACPCCHFLHLPVRPFPIERCAAKSDPPPADACDVCAALPGACRLPMSTKDLASLLDTAPSVLEDAREQRAATIFRLWIEATNGADALLMARFAEARDSVRSLSGAAHVYDGEEQEA